MLRALRLPLRTPGGLATVAIACFVAVAATACALSHSSLPRDVVTVDRAVDGGFDQFVPPDSAGCDGGLVRCGTTCVPIDTATRCGRCDNDCTTLPGVVPPSVTCVAGQCSITGACQPRYADCNGRPDDGCETDLSLPAHCGACANPCASATPLCSGSPGAYACSNGCSGATNTLCSGVCVDVTSDMANCGMCGHGCTPPANAHALCTGGACDFACDTGYHRCGTHCASDTSIMECGPSCTPCSAPGSATLQCAAGMCAIATCPANFLDCDGNVINGCETDIRTPAHCGSCTNACALANAMVGCSAGMCTIASCNSGFMNCNGLVPDGCETNTHTLANCGGCGMACSAPVNGSPSCSTGTCTFTCNTGYTMTGGSCVPSTPPNCGNQMLDPGETCDDGNFTAGDGCNPYCQLETAVAADNCPGTTLIAHTGWQWYTGTVAGANNDFQCINGTGGGPDRVYNLTMANAGNVEVQLIPSAGYDTVFQSRTGICPGTMQTFCRNAAGPGGTESVTGAMTTAGAQFTVIIDTVGAMTGTYQLGIHVF